jgi:hypothetical protein
MRLLKIITIICIQNSLSQLQNLAKPSQNMKATIQAITDVVEVFFIQQNITGFDYLLVNNSDSKFGQMIDGVRAKVSTHSSRVQLLETLHCNENEMGEVVYLNNSAVIFLSLSCYSTHHANRNKLMSEKIRIISYIYGTKDLLLKINLFSDFLHELEYVIWESDDDIQLLTREFYVDGKCETDLAQTKNYLKLNSFNHESLMWEKNLTFFEKNQNFHGCELLIHLPPSECLKHMHKNQLIPDLFSDMIEIFARKKNFTPGMLNCYRPPNSPVVEFLSLQKIMPNFHSLQFHYTYTLPIDNDELFLVVTPGEQFTSYEKLLLPFDFETWEYLTITFGFSFLLIFLMNFLPKTLRDIFYGKSVKAPAYNVVGKLRVNLIKFYDPNHQFYISGTFFG